MIVTNYGRFCIGSSFKDGFVGPFIAILVGFTKVCYNYER